MSARLENSFRTFRSADFAEKALLEALEQHRTIRDTSPDTLLKSHARRAISRVTLTEQRGDLIIKEYCYRSGSLLRRLFHTQRGRKAWRGALIAHRHGFPIPRHLALVQQRKGLFITSEFLVMEELPNALPLFEFLQAQHTAFPAQARRDAKRLLLRGIALDLQRMHRLGIYNRDLKAENILVPRDPGVGPRWFYIDLDGIGQYPVVFNRLRKHNLAQLNAALGAPVTLSDRYDFLLHYLGENSQSRRRVLKWIRSIMRITVDRRHIWPRPSI